MNEGRENLPPLAQSAWAADWDTPEEDKAWRNLNLRPLFGFMKDKIILKPDWDELLEDFREYME